MTLIEVYNQSLKKLEKPDTEEIVVRILICEINGIKTMSDFYLRKDEEIRSLPRYQKLFNRYLRGEPVQYILRKTEFYHNEYVIDNRVLIPRQETEEVVDFAIKKIRKFFGSKPIDVADICCGSGIMGISLAKNLSVNKIHFSDISKDAIDVAKSNCSRLDASVKFYVADALDALIKKGIKVDVLISNPPYVLRDEFVDDSVIENEPLLAIFTTDDFPVYKRILMDMYKIRKPNFLAIFEIGIYSRPILEKYIKVYIPNCEYGFIKDVNGKDRILYLQFKEETAV